MENSAAILLLMSKALTSEQFDIVADFLKITFGDQTKKYIGEAQKD